MKMETEISFITLNCWGIVGFSKDRVPRMEAIAEELATGKYDFAFLQEVWSKEDYALIKKKTEALLPYSHYFYSGVIGAGICIFSKATITDVFFHQWPVNGYVHKIQHGDWFGGKGLGLCQVLYKGLKINLYTTHLHAEYDRENDEYFAHRMTQAFDLAQFIRLTATGSDLAILGGDLNTEPGDLAQRIIQHTAALTDAFVEGQKKSGDSNYVGGTNETSNNTYTPKEFLVTNPHGKRIDYILYRAGDDVQVQVLQCNLPLPDRVPGKLYSYSDHEALVTHLKVSKFKGAPQPSVDPVAQIETLKEGIYSCDAALTKLYRDKHLYGLLAALCFVLIFSVGYFEMPYLVLVVTIIRVTLFVMLLFAVFMATIWNRMEVHAILSGKVGMEAGLNRYSESVPHDTLSSELPSTRLVDT